MLCFSYLSACMVGPNFHPLAPPPVHHYTPFPQTTKTVATSTLKNGGKVQYIHYGEALPQDWWRLFHSKEIDCLVKAGLHHSPTIVAARENLIEANEVLNATIGNGLFPAVSGQLTTSRQRIPTSGGGFSGSGGGGILPLTVPGATSGGTTGGTPSGSIFNLVNASVNVSYTLDLFGGIRRQIEASGAQVDDEAYLLQGTYLTLTANIVTTAITVASLREQIKATEELVRDQKKALAILNSQYRLGGISKSNVLTQEVLVEQTISTLPLLRQSLDKNKHLLSVLIGEFPSDDALPVLNLRSIRLPGYIPAGIPSLLVKQRPDILAAEALVHVASAQIGVATANLFPTLTLTGAYGYQSTSFSQLITGNNKIWNITSTLLAPIFNGGALMAQRRAAIATYNSAVAQYKQTVLQGFQNVADALRALENDARALKALRAAEIAAEQSLTLVKHQYVLGGTTYLSLLIAQQQYHTTTIARIRAEAARYIDTAALFQALGGGWWCPFDELKERNCCGARCEFAIKRSGEEGVSA